MADAGQKHFVVAGTGVAGLTAAVWLAVFGTWAFRFGPIYLRPRSDGRPG